MNIDLTGKTAVVTGGSGAIGGAMCEYYIKSGAQVAVVDVNAERGEEFVQTLRDMGGDAKFFQGDVSGKESMEKMCADVLGTFGKIDILVNNAGVNVGPEGRVPIQEFAEKDWNRIINIDLSGVYYCSGPISGIWRNVNTEGLSMLHLLLDWCRSATSAHLLRQRRAL